MTKKKSENDELLEKMYLEHKKILFRKHSTTHGEKIKKLLIVKKPKKNDEDDFFKNKDMRETLNKHFLKNLPKFWHEENIKYMLKTLRYITTYAYIGTFIILIFTGFKFYGFNMPENVLIVLIASIATSKITQSITSAIKSK